MKENLKKLGLENQYTFDRPQLVPAPTVVDTPIGVHHVLDDANKFVTPYGDNMRNLTGGHGFFVAFDAKTS